jgi:predicted transcriptional regulator
MSATYAQYGHRAALLAALQEDADGYWDAAGEYRFSTTYDGETRVYRGTVDFEAFTRDLLRQSKSATVEEAVVKAQALEYGDDIEWLLNAVLNQLDQV